jgi:hypothetical protein
MESAAGHYGIDMAEVPVRQITLTDSIEKRQRALDLTMRFPTAADSNCNAAAAFYPVSSQISFVQTPLQARGPTFSVMERSQGEVMQQASALQCAAFATINASQHVAATTTPLTRAPSQRSGKKNRAFEEQHGSLNPMLPLSAQNFTSAAAADALSDAQATLPPTDPALARSLTAQMHRLVARERGGGLKVPKSNEQWIAVGIWLASRDFPDLPFFLPLVDSETGGRLDLPVPYKSIMASLSPKYTDRDRILLHARVVQRLDDQGRLFGEVRYLCTDIAVSYQMGDNAFKWIIFQSVCTARACMLSDGA